MFQRLKKLATYLYNIEHSSAVVYFIFDTEHFNVAMEAGVEEGRFICTYLGIVYPFLFLSW